MPGAKGIGQAWFYHAPPKPKPRSDSPVLVPPMSQILCLNGRVMDDGEPVSTRNWIKESDSNYIRLAKQGGRPDLLTMMPSHVPDTSEPVGYPRCEWFYDNPPADKPTDSSNEPYEFMLPAYMVHPEPKPRESTDGYVDPRKANDRPTIAVTYQTAPPNGGKPVKQGVKKTQRRPVKKVDVAACRPPTAKPPEDHLGPNAIHKNAERAWNS